MEPRKQPSGAGVITFMRRKLHWLIFCALVLPFSLVVISAQAATRGPRLELVDGPAVIPPGATYAPDTVIVAFKKSVSAPMRQRSVQRRGLAVDVSCKNPDFVRLRLGRAAKAAGKRLESVIADLRRDPAVAYAEPDYVVRAAALYPDDPGFGHAYGLDNYGQAGGTPDADIDAPEAWDRVVGRLFTVGRREVKVAVLDTGVAYDHEDLKDNCRAAEGFDYFNNDADPADDNGHGTQVAGVIGAQGNNATGTTGVCHVVQMVPIKVLNNVGVGTASMVANGILLARTRNVRVINLSLSFGVFRSMVIQSQISAAAGAGILVVAAAGNNGALRGTALGEQVGADIDATPNFPAAYNRILNNVISVASTDRNDNLSTFSNYGANSVDIAAAGEDIVTTTTTGNTLYTISNPVNGTSMSAPYVTGAAALIWAFEYNRYLPMNPVARLNELKHRILGSADVLPSLQGKIVGGRRLNLDRAIRAADTIDPGIPVGLRVIKANSTSVILRWIASGDDGGTGIATAYDLRYSTSPIAPNDLTAFLSATRVTLPSVVPGPVQPGAPQEALVAGLNGGQAYYFALKAIDEMGRTSPQAAVATYTPASGASIELLNDDATTEPAFAGASPWVADQTDATAPSADQKTYMDSPGGNYAANLAGLALTQTAPVVLSVGNPRLEYTLRRALGTGDRLQVDISTDNGNSYSPIRQFLSGTTGFQTFTENLNAYAGQTIVLAFRLFSNGTGEADGVSIDHIRIYGQQSNTTCPFFDDAEGFSTFSFVPNTLPRINRWDRSGDDNFTPGGSFNYSDSPDGNYPNSNASGNPAANVFMVQFTTAAQLVDFTPLLQFQAKIQLETNRDFFLVLVSTDDGATYSLAMVTTGIANDAWNLYTIPLYGAYGKRVRLAFQTFRDSDTGTTQRDGVHLDDIRICGEVLNSVGGLPPADPSDLEAFPTSATSVQLDWSDNSSDETNFLLERSIASGPFQEIARLPADTETYADTNLAPDTHYRYRVRATNANGDSQYTLVDPALTSPPDGPFGANARAMSASTVSVQWTDFSDDEPNSEGDQNGTGFVVERSDNGGTTFTQIALVPPSPGWFGNVVFNDTTVLTGQGYLYRIKARNYVGDSGYTTSNAVRVAAPLPPGPLTARLNAPGQIRLDWVDNSSDETTFLIERSVDADFGNPMNIVAAGSTLPDQTSSIDTNGGSGFTLGTTYYYRVRARNAVGDSAYSNTAAVTYDVSTPPSDVNVTVPDAPAGINRLDISWTDNSSDETGFQVQRATDDLFTQNVVNLPTTAPGVTSISNTGLASNTKYFYRVRALNPISPDDGSDFRPALPVGPPACNTTLIDVPAVPGSIDATALGNPARIEVKWVDGSDTETTFELEWSTDGGTNWGPLHNEPSTSTASLGQEYTFIHMTGVGGFHTYRVRAVNSSGAGAYRTLAVSVDMNLPAAPSNLTAKAETSGMLLQVKLDWQDNSNNEDNFIIERSTDADFSVPANIVEVATTGSNINSRIDTNSGAGLASDTTYYYRVRASRVVGESANSNIASVRTSRPAAPETLLLEVRSNTRIKVTWTDKADNEDQFVIQRAPDVSGAPGAFVDLPSVIGPSSGVDGQVSHTDTNLTGATTYWYQVVARNGVGESPVLGPASATTLPDPPVEPTALTATVLSGTHVQLRWRDNSNNETRFELERSTSGGAVVVIFNVGANDETTNVTVTFDDNAPGSVEPGSVYTYRVRALNNNPLPSLWSNSVTADVTLPGTPGTLQATPLTGTSIRLNWQDNSNNETAFILERSRDNFADPMNTVLATTTGPGVTVYIDNNGGAGLTPGTTYYYRLRATNTVGESANSNVAFATTYVVPAAPQGLQATTLSGSEIRLNWTDGSTNEQGFRIERRQGSGSWMLLPAIIGANITTHVDSGLSSDTQYAYRVFAFNQAGAGPNSNEATATTHGIPDAPTSLRVVKSTGTTVDLAWNDNSNDEDGFRLERRIGAASTFTVIATLQADRTTFTDSSLTVNQTYTYQIRAYNLVGNSGYSNAVTVTTSSNIAAPTSLTATPLSGRRMLLRWTDNSNNETYFRIERSISGGAFREIGAVGTNITRYTDSGLTAGRTYTYRVRAYRSGAGGGFSAYSNQTSAVAILRPVGGRGRRAPRRR